MLRSIIVVALLGSAAFAQQPAACPANEPCKVTPPPKVGKPKAPPVHDMGAMDLRAKNRKVMLMTFLERASAELERASLEQRSFIPELVKTVDTETL